MERINCEWYNRNQIVCRFKDQGEQMYVLVTGQVGQYNAIRYNMTEDAVPDEVYEPISTFGEENLRKDSNWDATFKALKRTLLLIIMKKDLIEVLQHVKVLTQSNK